MKKISSPKSTKVLSKVHLQENQLNMLQVYKFIQKESCNQISRLQKLLNDQIQQRIVSQNELLEMIKRLQVTKKSKLPAKPHLQTINKLNSTKNKNQWDHQQFKNILLKIKQENEAELSIKQSIQNKVSEQVSKIKIQLDQIKTIKITINQIKAEIKDSKIQAINFLKKDISNVSLQINNLRQEIQIIQKNIIQNKYKFDKLNQNQSIFLEKTDQRLNQKIGQTQKCAKICIQTLKKIQIQIRKAFQSIENQIKVTSQSIIETKESIQQNFYGSEYKSKGKFDSQSSIDYNLSNINFMSQKTNESAEKLHHFDKRMQILQRRLDFLYSQYLTQPFAKQYK